jgi:hypothetical protein
LFGCKNNANAQRLDAQKEEDLHSNKKIENFQSHSTFAIPILQK